MNHPNMQPPPPAMPLGPQSIELKSPGPVLPSQQAVITKQIPFGCRVLGYEVDGAVEVLGARIHRRTVQRMSESETWMEALRRDNVVPPGVYVSLLVRSRATDRRILAGRLIVQPDPSIMAAPPVQIQAVDAEVIGLGSSAFQAPGNGAAPPQQAAPQYAQPQAAPPAQPTPEAPIGTREIPRTFVGTLGGGPSTATEVPAPGQLNEGGAAGVGTRREPRNIQGSTNRPGVQVHRTVRAGNGDRVTHMAETIRRQGTSSVTVVRSSRVEGDGVEAPLAIGAPQAAPALMPYEPQPLVVHPSVAPLVQSIAAPVDPVADELVALRAENARLRAEAASPQASAPVAPVAPVALAAPAAPAPASDVLAAPSPDSLGEPSVEPPRSFPVDAPADMLALIGVTPEEIAAAAAATPLAPPEAFAPPPELPTSAGALAVASVTGSNGPVEIPVEVLPADAPAPDGEPALRHLRPGDMYLENPSPGERVLVLDRGITRQLIAALERKQRFNPTYRGALVHALDVAKVQVGARSWAPSETPARVTDAEIAHLGRFVYAGMSMATPWAARVIEALKSGLASVAVENQPAAAGSVVEARAS